LKRFLLALALVGSLHADALFTFDADPLGSPKIFTDASVGGAGFYPVIALLQNYNSTASINVVQVNPVVSPLITGRAVDIVKGSLIGFSQDLSALSFSISIGNTQNLFVSLFENNTLVARDMVSTFTTIGGNLVGVISTADGAGESFNFLQLSTGDGQHMLIDNLNATAFTPTPEPSSLAMFGFSGSLVGLGLWGYKKRSASSVS
jgi:hypothetical protein